ncbi:hypothetical protein M8818_001425 [Zalaria obscura]|uniref:Uncharacterized protein n=1 Tax=Zalaria obscura TaxID=2024903 RepID=A0ACC3SLQ1_9PEZI
MSQRGAIGMTITPPRDTKEAKKGHIHVYLTIRTWHSMQLPDVAKAAEGCSLGNRSPGGVSVSGNALVPAERISHLHVPKPNI